MRAIHIVCAGALGLGILTSIAAATPDPAPAVPEQDMVLWYRQQALKWIESLPIGNGHIGARVFGGPATSASRSTSPPSGRDAPMTMTTRNLTKIARGFAS